ncbi:MAG: NAD(P)H-quinone oxidoreductase [Devosiaceae bacterium]|nr:NAD(P)H-quinone oxidoreductase [Devosiaceae bacterium MH13]
MTLPATLPDTVTVVTIDRPGGPEVLVPATRAMPQGLTPTQVLIKVEAAGVNRPDVLQRVGAYPPPKGASDIPGLEVAGEIVAAGRDANRYALGTPVTALVTSGGYADYCIADERHALPIPAGLSTRDAAGIPETAFTVWSNVFDRGGLQAGENFLVHGGTSGIGAMAIQLAKAKSATVLATAGSDEKCATMRQLGADHTFNYQTEDYVEGVKAATSGAGANVILDMVGGDYIERNWKAAAVEGRIIQIAFLNGANVEADFSRLMLKRLTHTGSTLRARDDGFKAALAASVEREVWPLIESGAIKIIVDSVYPLAEAAEAHRRMESSQHTGKILLTP